MVVSKEQLKQIAPMCDADKWAPALDAAMQEFAINTPARAAMFLAQCAHESQQLRVLSENLNYSAVGLTATWRNRFPPTVVNGQEVPNALAKQLARRPVAIANYVYANRNGNGSEASGDGWNFRGRGPIQITGRAMYAVMKKALGVDCLTTPDLILDPAIGARASAYLWYGVKGLNTTADRNTEDAFVSITRAINGGLNGLADRMQFWDAARTALNV